MVSNRKKLQFILMTPIMVACFLSFTGSAGAVTADEPIAGYSLVTAAQLDAELSYVNPGHIHPDLAQLYVYWGSRFGIKADLAFAQMIHETNYLRYTGDVRPWQNNFAGIGATGGGNPGNSFPNAEAGVIAHYAHLAWYIFPNHVNEYCNSYWDPRHFEPGHRNTVRTLRDLGGKWAVPGTGYGDALARLATRIWGPSDPNYSSYPIIGGIRGKWDGLSGAPRMPLNAEYSITSADGQVIGQAQDFENGRIIWNPAGGTYWIHGGILAKYDLSGREPGPLGMPKSDEYGAAEGRAHEFAGGNIYWSAATAAHIVTGDILAKYLEVGGPAVFGFPLVEEQDVAGVSGAWEIQFSKGRIYNSGATGVHGVHGAIFTRYLADGGPGALGLPTADEAGAGPWGGLESRFEHGSIYWSAGGGAHVIFDHIDIYGRFIELGGVDYLGVPTTDVSRISVTGVGEINRCDFQMGRLISQGGIDTTNVVRGAILTKYIQLGSETGPLGIPSYDETGVYGVPEGRESRFTAGRIYWSPGTGAHGLQGAMYDKYLNGGAGGPGVYGLPTTDAYPAWSGYAQNTQGAIITWDSSLGAHLVRGGVMVKYQMLGGPAGSLHLITNEEHVISGVAGSPEAVQADFQNGQVFWSLATSSHTVNGGIYVRYLDAGGPTGALGLPLTDEYSIPLAGGGRRSQFQHGFITWGALYGTWVDYT